MTGRIRSVFVGATGIAVRLIAPWVKDKRQDPAVLVMDEEEGEFCIPLLSGHIGGANEQALYLSGKLSMTPVITTATDKNSCFAVDVFARKRDLLISSMTYVQGGFCSPSCRGARWDLSVIFR